MSMSIKLKISHPMTLLPPPIADCVPTVTKVGLFAFSMIAICSDYEYEYELRMFVVCWYKDNLHWEMWHFRHLDWNCTCTLDYILWCYFTIILLELVLYTSEFILISHFWWFLPKITEIVTFHTLLRGTYLTVDCQWFLPFKAISSLNPGVLYLYSGLHT